MGSGVIGPDRERSLVAVGGVDEAAEVGEQVTVIAVGLGAIRIEGEGAFVGAPGLVVAVRLAEDVAEIVVVSGIAGAERHRAGDELGRDSTPVRQRADDPEEIQRAGVQRRHPEDPETERLRTAEPARAVMRKRGLEQPRGRASGRDAASGDRWRGRLEFGLPPARAPIHGAAVRPRTPGPAPAPARNP